MVLMTKCIVLCLNAFTKLQNLKEASHHRALMGNYLTCSHMPWPYQSTKWFVVSTRCCAMYEIVSIDKKIDLKFIQIKILKNIARMTRRLLPRDIEILGWCPVGSVVSHGEKVPL